MKVLQINAVYRYASTGRTCEELQQYLIKYGEECISVYGENKEDYPNTVYLGNAVDHKLHAFLSRLTGKVGYYSTLPTLKLIRFMNKYKPDVVHLRVLHSNFINIPLLLRYLGNTDIPTVITLHDCFFFTGKCCHYIEAKCDKWTMMCSTCPSFKEWNKSWFFDRTEKMFKDKLSCFLRIPRLEIVGVSNWITEEAKRSPMFRNRIIRTVYNSIDLQVFRPNPGMVKEINGIIDKKMILGVASEWNEDKGYSDFIKLSHLLPKEFVIVLIGTINSKLPKAESIINLPRTNNTEELSHYYSDADVFLQLSRQETFGKVTAEALACGTPVITYNNTANAEMAFSDCGYCVEETGDVNDVAKYIILITNHEKSYYRNKCRETAESLFDLNENFERYLSIYKEVCCQQKIEG